MSRPNKSAPGRAHQKNKQGLAALLIGKIEGKGVLLAATQSNEARQAGADQQH